MNGGKNSLSPNVLKNLSFLGQAIDVRQQLHVFDGGQVKLGNEAGRKYEENEHAQSGERPPARSRSRQRAPSGQRRRASREQHHFGSEAHETAYGAGFRFLARHYESLAFEDDLGLWVAVSSFPLGTCGPQANFLIGALFDRRIMPRAWAFSRLGPKAKSMPLKHTNFPDASICAMTKEDNAWSPDDGLVALVDHYSIWAVKSWHREIFGFWPGPQYGYGSYYRKREFVGNEWCGCGSDKRYKDCHQGTDLLQSEVIGREQFRRAFLCDYETRAVPQSIMNAAKSKWKVLPSLASAFSHRRVVVGGL